MCCGCEACSQACPKACIEMRVDDEGFFYPVIDYAICVDCGLCEKVCPVINKREALLVREAYAIKNPSKFIQQQSSSGGFFSLVSEYVLQNKGVVFGARFDKDWGVRMDYVEERNDLSKFRGSKYVQCRNEETFAKAREFLKNGKLVLYTGTPCQIAALKNFLGRDYTNLITIDFICHGVPSPGVWQKYLSEQKNKLSLQSIANEKDTFLSSSLKERLEITGINFREKAGFGWEKFGFIIRGMSVSKMDQNQILFSEMHSHNPFMKGFLSNITIRPSCSLCPAKGGRSQSDISMADFWGIKEIDRRFYDPNGVSLVFVHTEKGDSIMKKLVCEKKSVTPDDIVFTNISYMHSSPLHPKRIAFFSRWKSESVVKLLEEFAKPSLLDKLKFIIRMILIKLNLNYKLNKLLKKR